MKGQKERSGKVYKFVTNRPTSTLTLNLQRALEHSEAFSLSTGQLRRARRHAVPSIFSS